MKKSLDDLAFSVRPKFKDSIPRVLAPACNRMTRSPVTSMQACRKVMDSSALVALPHQEWKNSYCPSPSLLILTLFPQMFFGILNGALIDVLKWIYRRKTQARKLDLLMMAESPPQAGHITIRAFSDNYAERKDHTKIQNFERLSQIYLQLEIFAVKNLQKQV